MAASKQNNKIDKLEKCIVKLNNDKKLKNRWRQFKREETLCLPWYLRCVMKWSDVNRKYPCTLTAFFCELHLTFLRFPFSETEIGLNFKWIENFVRINCPVSNLKESRSKELLLSFVYLFHSIHSDKRYVERCTWNGPKSKHSCTLTDPHHHSNESCWLITTYNSGIWSTNTQKNIHSNI